jgi:two-component system capsular synthesis sensor histidine kinase RcsC
LSLLARIYKVQLERDGAGGLPSPESLASVNDDMMILVVDDHPINRRLLADQLGSLGYQCKTANDGVDALNVLSKIILISCSATSTCLTWTATV